MIKQVDFIYRKLGMVKFNIQSLMAQNMEVSNVDKLYN